MAEINWGLAVNRTNPFAEAINGFQQGTEMRRQTERDNLFAQRQEFEISEANRKRQAEEAAAARKAKVGGFVAQGDYAGARTAAEGDFDMLESIGKLDEGQRKAARDNAEDLGGFAAALKNVPYEQRRAIIAQARETLTSYGLKPEQIEAFDPTDQALDAQVMGAMDLKTALEEANRQRDDARAGEKAQADEAYRKQQLGLARQRVGIAADSNRRGWASFNERKKAGGFGTPGVGGAGIADDDVEIDP